MEKNVQFRTDRLKELRKKENLTQKEFSAKIGCTMASLSAYENGSKLPPSQTLMNIANIFNCSIDWLFGLKNEKNYDLQECPAKTYAEYIKLLFALKNKDIAPYPGCDCTSSKKSLKNYKGIAFSDPVIKLFLEKWQDIEVLYETGTIDSTLFTAWKDKIMKDFNYDIITTEEHWQDFTTLYITLIESGFTEYDATIEALDGTNPLY